MVRKEPQLVLFTILTQLSTGLVAAWGFSAILASRRDFILSAGFARHVLSVALLVLVLGVLAASLHLGQPRRFALALVNLRRSWLSREGLAGLIYGGLVGVLWQFSMCDAPSFGLNGFLVAAASLAGLVLVWGIARLYMLRTVPTWNHPGTPAAFFATSLLLGTAAFQVMYAWFNGQSRAPVGWSRHFDWALIGLVGLQELISLSSLAYLSTREEKPLESLRVVWLKLRPLFYIRWMLVMVSIGMMFARTSDGAILGIRPPGAALLVFGLLAGSEIIGRWIFYGSYRRVGI